jgi:hypothetical protein
MGFGGYETKSVETRGELFW